MARSIVPEYSRPIAIVPKPGGGDRRSLTMFIKTEINEFDEQIKALQKERLLEKKKERKYVPKL